MINVRALNRAITVGTLLQITLAVLGYYSPWIVLHGALFMGMMISATAGFLYAQEVGPGMLGGLVPGAIAGGTCAFVGFALSVGLGTMDLHDFWLRTVISIGTGAVGGPWGQMSFTLRRMGY